MSENAKVPRSRQIDRADRRILALLQQNARLSYKDIAKRVNLSPTPCLRRVGLLEQAGIIQRYKAVLDPDKLGYTIRAFVQITRRREMSREHVWESITAIPEVIACHVVSGDADLLVELVARDMEHYSDILLERINKIEGVYDSNSVFSMKALKMDGAIPVGDP